VKRIFLSCAFLILTTAVLSAEVDFSIRFYDKSIYSPGSSVRVKITLRNESPETYRFKLADDKMFSIVFDLKTITNRALERSDIFIRKQERNQPVFFRELALQPGEEYSFVEDLAEYVKIQDTGVFTLSCRFFPELQRSSPTAKPIESNQLTLSVRPSMDVSPIKEMIDNDSRQVLKKELLPPDEVVRRTISARQKGRWNEFFLYIDLESLLSRDSAKKEIYRRESDAGRQRMLDIFKADMMREFVDGDIATIPSDFEITSTDYSPSKGKVVVMERFRYTGYVQKMQYTYYMKRSDDIWYIYDYTSVPKGTE
jgi:hypothetical protein